MPYRVLLVDDENQYYESQKSAGLIFDLVLEHIDNWEQAEAKLRDDPDYYEAIIVDGKGKLKSNERGENQKQVSKALTWRAAQIEMGRHVIMVINTGYLDDINEIADLEGIHCYSKGEEKDKLFPELVKMISQKPLNRLIAKYPEIYELFEKGYLPATDWEKLSRVIISWENKAYKKSDLNDLRDILESVFKSANRIDSAEFLPNTLVDPRDGRPKLGWIEHYWQGKDVMQGEKVMQKKSSSRIIPEEITSNLITLLRTVQAYSHNKEPLNRFVYFAAVYNLFTILTWFKSYAESKYPDKT